MSSYALLPEKISGSDTDDTTEDFDSETVSIEKPSPCDRSNEISKNWIAILIVTLS